MALATGAGLLVDHVARGEDSICSTVVSSAGDTLDDISEVLSDSFTNTDAREKLITEILSNANYISKVSWFYRT